MKILTLVHEGGTGGSQRNAVDLAMRLVQRGHEVTIATPEAMALPPAISERVIGYGALRPSPTRISRIRSLVRSMKPDVVHAYEWPPILETLYALGPRSSVGVLGTVLSMSVAPETPRSVPLLVGTPSMRDRWQSEWHAPIDICLPPVDLAGDRRDPLAAARFRADLGIGRDEFVVVAVSRVARAMKLSGLLQTMRAVAQCGAGIRLVIVGDGDAMPHVRAAARALNQMVGAPRIGLTGARLDPRSAYSAADLVVGMGGSALRAMAHERPVIVVGESGFAQPADQQTIDHFGRFGFFGVGSDESDPVGALARQIDAIRNNPAYRHQLGRLGREYVAAHHSDDRITDGVEAALARSIHLGSRWQWTEALRAGAAASQREIRLKLRTPRLEHYDGVWTVNDKQRELAA